MQTDNAAVYWLILATSISSVTTAILYLFQRCCGEFWGNISSVCFQNFAASLEIREGTFHQVTNLLIFPRIFQQLQLDTFKDMWIHDANAQTGDCVQWGWFRLPTKSYVLSFLAVCGVTHYVWIPSDLKSVSIVGPADAIAILIDLSNVAATTRLEETQLHTLRHAFGMGDACTKADKVCTLWERRFLVWILSVCYLGLVCMLKPGPARIIAAVVGFFVAVARACWHNVFKARRVLSYLPWRRRRAHIDYDIDLEDGLTENLRDSDSLGSPTQIIAEVCDSAAPCRTVEASDNEASEVLHQTSNIIYSVLTARVYYYEVVKQTKAIPKPDEPMIVRFEEEAQLYAVQLRPNFVHHLAERTFIPDDASLHVCVHNPMVDPYLIELYQNFQKGVDRENLLMIILPPLVHFNSCFKPPLLARARTAKCTQFVTTLGDFETLLLQMTAGFIPKLVFVLPIDEESTYDKHIQEPFEVWRSIERVLGVKNCHWA